MADDTLGKRRFGFTGVITVVLIALIAWLVAGTEWSLVTDEHAVLSGLAIEDAHRSGEGACEAAIDVDGLPARPSAVAVRRDTGDESIEIRDGRGTLTYPASGDSLVVRLTFEGMLHKPSHADITLAQRGCQLQPASLRSMPLLPF